MPGADSCIRWWGLSGTCRRCLRTALIGAPPLHHRPAPALPCSSFARLQRQEVRQAQGGRGAGAGAREVRALHRQVSRLAVDAGRGCWRSREGCGWRLTCSDLASRASCVRLARAALPTLSPRRSKNMPNTLFCALTGELLNARLAEVKLHLRGKKFARAQGAGLRGARRGAGGVEGRGLPTAGPAAAGGTPCGGRLAGAAAQTASPPAQAPGPAAPPSTRTHCTPPRLPHCTPSLLLATHGVPVAVFRARSPLPGGRAGAAGGAEHGRRQRHGEGRGVRGVPSAGVWGRELMEERSMGGSDMVRTPAGCAGFGGGCWSGVAGQVWGQLLEEPSIAAAVAAATW